MIRVFKILIPIFILVTGILDSKVYGNNTEEFNSINISELTSEELLEKANQLYMESRFEEAAEIYEHLTELGYLTGPVLYNLANSYYRSNRIALAILNYERALIYGGANREDILHNLEVARLNIRDRIEDLPVFFLNRWWQNLRDSLHFTTWAAISAATFIILLLTTLIFLFSARVVLKKLFFWLAMAFFIVSVISFTLGLDQRNYKKNHNGAIVFSPSVQVKSSPDQNSTDLFLIHEGTKVYVTDSIGNWRSVTLTDGNQGWLRIEDIEMI